MLLPQLQLPPTVTLAAPGSLSGVVTWCPTQPEQLVEDEEGIVGEGEDKPVECSICCRRFKNTPALNGHMRLHGGYFKKVYFVIISNLSMYLIVVKILPVKKTNIHLVYTIFLKKATTFF